MSFTEAVLGLIDLQPREMRRAQGILRHWVPIMASIFTLAFVAIAWVAVDRLDAAWQSGQWDDKYWQQFFELVTFPSALLAIQLTGFVLKAAVRMSPKQLRGGTLALREAAARGDERTAPVVEHLSTVLYKDEVRPLPAQFGPFKRPNGEQVVDEALTGAFLLFCGMLCFAGAGGAWFGLASDPTRPGVVIGLVMIGAVLMVWGAQYLLQARRMRRPALVTADELGMRWMQVYPRRREIHVLWGDVRSFSTIVYAKNGIPRRAFVVDGGGAILAWDLDRLAPGGAGLASDRLSHLILARTGLPLRDMSRAVELVTVRPWEKGFAKVVEAFGGGTGAIAVWPHMPRPRTRLGVVCVALAGLFPLLLIPTLYIAGQELQRQQSQQYAALLAQVRSHAPLYHDALTAADDDWRVQAPTTADPNTYAFANGSYAISATATDQLHFPQAFAPGTYSDVAVEVTMRYSGGESTFGTTGLILHASDDASDEVTFSLENTRSAKVWGIIHTTPYDGTDPSDKWGYFSNQNSRAINAGPGAANRLDVIMRGPQYICYINGMYVSTFQDPAPRSGRVGVGILDSQGTGAFNDFTVYPL